MFYIVLLIVLGVLFLIAELLLLPGVSVGTILALVCYGSAIYLAFTDFGITTGIIVLAVILVLSLITTVLSLRAKTWRKLALQQEIDSQSMENPAAKIAIGSIGVTISRLSPMGKVEIDGELHEAKSLDSYIEQRKRIEVVGFDNFTVIVKAIE